MKKNTPGMRAAHRIDQSQPEHQLSKTSGNTIGLEEDIAIQLESYKRKNAINKTRFASAAIRYFLERGLDPTQTTGASEAILTRTEITKASHDIRQQNKEMSDHLATAIANGEAGLYRFMQQQYAHMVSYLQSIEVNILTRQEELATLLLHRITRNGAESALNRSMLEALTLHFDNQFYSLEDLRQSHEEYDVRREQLVLDEMNNLLAELSKTALEATPTPAFPTPIQDGSVGSSGTAGTTTDAAMTLSGT